MSQTITNRITGETLTVYLELGDDLWLRDEGGEIEHVERAHLPAERWCFDGTRNAGDDVPRTTLRLDFPSLPARMFDLSPHAPASPAP
jgi:hypothetical protein